MSPDARGMTARRETLTDEKYEGKEGERRGWPSHCSPVHSGQCRERLGRRPSPSALGHGVLMDMCVVDRQAAYVGLSGKGNSGFLLKQGDALFQEGILHTASITSPLVFDREQKSYAIPQCHGEAKETASLSHRKGSPWTRYH